MNRPSYRLGRRWLISTWILAAALSAAAWTPPSAEGAWSVWTLSRTERVLRGSPPGKGTDVRLAAARGEVESFQILMRSDKRVRGISLVPDDLIGPGDAAIRAEAAVLYRQHALHITVPTHRNDAFQPGWYPDGLIPFRHPVTGKSLSGARLQAVPFDLPRHETHGFWIDLPVPPDARPGEYRGTYRLSGEGVPAVEVRVTLTVWDFVLPRVSTLQTALGSPAARMRGYYRPRAEQGKETEPVDWEAVEAQCANLLSRHRINATPPSGSLEPVIQPDGSFRIADDQIAAFRAFVDQYHVNAFCVPHPSRAVKDPVAQKDKLHEWLAAWDQAAERLDRPVLFYTYLRDEPNDAEAYRYVQKWGRAIREANSVVKVLVVEQTWPQKEEWGDLYGAVDIWCPLFSLFKPEPAAERQAAGETIWTYTALCQRDKTPWWHTDFPLLHYRVPAWTAWRYRIRGLLYWGGMSFWKQVDDPWTEPGTLDRRQDGRGPLFNGEGSLLYPARAVGYEGIAPSLRLKALRDGIEDYEYLAVLERLGLAAPAQEVVLGLTPSWFTWEPNPSAYDAARAELAAMIVASQKRGKERPHP